MKNVLIALDYNETAEKIAEKGYALAKAMGAEVHLLHVISNPAYYSSLTYSPIMGFSGYVDLDPLQGDYMKSLNEYSVEFLNQAKNHLYDQTIYTLVKEGGAAETILTCASELDIDVIVLGSHSSRWLEKIIMGSVTERVLQNSIDIPLFIVPTKKQ